MSTFKRACALFVGCAAVAPLLGGLPDGHRGAAYIALHVAMSVVMLAATWAFRSADMEERRLLLTAAVLARVVAATSAPYTSNDVHRYVWDGHLLIAGGDPWSTSPSEVSVTDWPRPPDNLEIASLYPPGAMLLFSVAAAAGPRWSESVWKLLVTIAGVLVVLVVARTLQGTAQVRWLPLVALSPLLVLEASVGAHLDLVVALAVSAVFLAARSRHFILAGAFIGAGALVKFTPLVLLLPLALSSGWRAGVRATGSALAVVAVGYAIPSALGLEPLGSLVRFVTSWRFGTPVALVDRLVGPPATSVAAAVLGGALLLACAWCALRRGFLSAAPWALMAPLIASPVAFPWYLAPTATAAAQGPSVLALVWLTLSPLTYEVIDSYRLTGRFEAATWPLVVVSAGMMVGALVDLRRALRGSAT
ncbi:MAG: glycosyltransferase family 87 protein [Myxococcaceae bacterium]